MRKTREYATSTYPKIDAEGHYVLQVGPAMRPYLDDLAGWFKRPMWQYYPADYGGFVGEDSPATRRASGLPLRAKDSAPSDSLWEVQRHGDTGHEGDDWYPRDSWGMRKIVRPSRDGRTAVFVEVHVHGAWKERPGHGRVAVPRYFTASVRCGGYCREVKIGGRWRWGCKSLADAQRKALALDIDEPVGQVLHDVYARRNATEVYQLRDGIWEPLATLFGSYDSLDMPTGEYVTASLSSYWSRDDNRFGLRRSAGTMRVSHGYSSGPGGDIGRGIFPVEPWLLPELEPSEDALPVLDRAG